MCVLFLLTRHLRSSLLGPGWWNVPTTYAVKGCYEMDLLLTAVGVEIETESPVELFFIMDATWPPRGCCCSVKQDHQFLNKISTPLIKKNPCDFYKVLTLKWHVSQFEPNRIISLQITVIQVKLLLQIFKTIEKSEFHVLIKHCFLMGKKYCSSKAMAW